MRINVANDEMLGRTTGELKKEIDLHCDFNKYLLREIEKAGKEIERLNNIIKEIKDYFEDLEIFAPSRDIKYDILDIIEGSDKE